MARGTVYKWLEKENRKIRKKEEKPNGEQHQ